MFRDIKTIHEDDLEEWDIDDLFDYTPLIIIVDNKEVLIKEKDLLCTLDKYPDFIRIYVGNKEFRCEIDTIELFNQDTVYVYLNKILDFKEKIVRYINTSTNIIIKTYKQAFLLDVEDMINILLDKCIITVDCLENCK